MLLEKSCPYNLSYLLLFLESLYAISTQFDLAFCERTELNHVSPKSQTYCLLYLVPDFRICDNMPGGWRVYYHVLKSVSKPTADLNPNGVMVPVSERICYKTAHYAA